MQAREHVIVWSGLMLNPSETFIRNQARAMQRFVPQYAGVRYSDHSLLSREECMLINEGGTSGKLREAIFKLTGAAPRLRRRLAPLRPRLMHAHHGVNGALALPLAKSLGIPLVVTFHGADATVHKAPDHYSLAHRAFVRRLEQLKRDVALFTADSAFIRRKLIERGYPAEKIVTHHVGVNVGHFRADPEVKREPVVLFVGRLAEKKGVEYLIRAMERVQAALPGLRLVIAGDGPLKPSLEAQAVSLKQCTFLGLQSSDQVKAWMNRATVFAAPSVTAANGDSEGLPTVIVEAMAMGLPVVATDHAGNTEAITHGQTGLISQERDWEALAGQITQICSDRDLWQRLSGNARAQVERSFDINSQTRILEGRYQEILDRTAAGEPSAELARA